MTRAELLAMIYEDNTVRSCPTEEVKCELEDSEINSQEYCKKCAEMLLTEYENKIRAEERARVLEEVMAIVKAKLSEKEYPIKTMVELTDLGAKLEIFKKEQSHGNN